MAKKVKLPVIGGLQKVIHVPTATPAGTTIKEIGANTITIAQLRTLLGLQNTTGGGSSSGAPVAALVPGPGLSGGGVLVGAVGIRLTAPIPALLYEGDAGEDGQIGPPGRDGRIGVDGRAGPAVYMAAEDGQDGDIGPPGARGATGAAGAAGSAGTPGPAVYFVADDPEEVLPIPGARGPAGSAGTTGAPGPAGPAVCFLDDFLAEDAILAVPGDGIPYGGTTAQFLRGDRTWSNTLLGTFEVNGSANLAASYGPTIGIASNVGGASQVIYFGDGSGYIFTLAARVGGVTSAWLTYDDTGHAVFHSPTAGTALTVNAVTGGASGLVVTDGTVKVDTFFGASVGLFGTSTNHPIRLMTNSLPRIIIAAAGNVQIGAPTGTVTALNVLGTGNIEVATFQASAGNATYIGLIDGQAGNAEWLIASGLVGAGVFAIYSGATAAAQMYCSAAGNWNIAPATSGVALTVSNVGTADTMALVASSGRFTSLLFKNVSTLQAQLVWDNTAGTFFIGVTSAVLTINGASGTITLAAATAAGTLVVNQATGQNAILIATTGFDASMTVQTTTTGSAVLNLVTLGVTAMSIGNRRSDGAIVICAGAGLATPKAIFASGGNVTFVNAIGVNNSAPPAKVTGWGTPAGPAVVITFPATPTLAQCGQAIGKIIVDLKALGFYGA